MDIFLWASIGIIAIILWIRHYINDLKRQREKINFLYASLQKKDEEISQLKNESQNMTIINKNLSSDICKLKKELENHQNTLQSFLESNLKSIPFLAGMISDYLTYDFEILAKKLDWGCSIEREKKVKAIREIRKDAQERITQAKIAIYQLEYIKQLYPIIEDVLSEEYTSINFTATIPEYDPVRNYISIEEWNSLSETERNQKALDNYVTSHKKNKWQIGRDYELFVGYEFQKKGYDVTYFGIEKGLEDLGRDLIVKLNGKIGIVQCKYWSKEKTIHEKHIFQLYGTIISYCIDEGIDAKMVKGIFVTNTKASSMAKKVASQFRIHVIEEHSIDEFPRIKCNINYDEYGIETRIYHLPMDQQYDNVKISQPNEFMALTVAQAEMEGFRRAHRWSKDK